MSRLSQFEENLKLVEKGALSSDVLERCDQVWEKLRGPHVSYSR